MEQVLVAFEERMPPLDGDGRIRPAIGVGPDQANHSHHHGCRSSGHEVRGPHPGEVQELAQQPAQPVALPHDQAGQEPLVLVGVLGAGELLDRAPNRRERITDLVGQRGAQLRYRLQPLGPHVELLNLLEVRDVGEDGGDRRSLLRLLPEGGGAQADREHPPAALHAPSPRPG